MKLLKRILIILFILLLILFASYKVYVSKYYHSNYESDECIEIDNQHIFNPDSEATIGFIFYPGAKVEAESYAPLMEQLSDNGIFCVLVEMPDNLAILDIDAADSIKAQYPNITEWYVGGHSLGGAMVSSYVADHVDEYKGLILLASYSTKDLSDSNLKVLSIYGENDEVLNLEKMEEYKENLPQDFLEVVIDGGCHANFADYGKQKGDGVCTISNINQIQETSNQILQFIKK